MNRVHTIIFLLFVFLLYMGVSHAEESKMPVPVLAELVALVGQSKDSDLLKQFVKKYNFREDIKAKGSWACSYGIFLDATDDGVCWVGFCPEQFSPAEGLVVELPFKLSSKDKIDDIIERFGKPVRTLQDPEAYYEIHYNDFKVTFLRGKLSEIWLIPQTANNTNDNLGSGSDSEHHK